MSSSLAAHRLSTRPSEHHAHRRVHTKFPVARQTQSDASVERLGQQQQTATASASGAHPVPPANADGTESVIRLSEMCGAAEGHEQLFSRGSQQSECASPEPTQPSTRRGPIRWDRRRLHDNLNRNDVAMVFELVSWCGAPPVPAPVAQPKRAAKCLCCHP